MDLSATQTATAHRPRPTAANRTPIDHAHLARYTFGNRELEVEVLGLFAAQAPQTLDWLRTAANPKGWRDAAHTLKGSARAVGAWQVATAAEEAEALGFSELEARREATAVLAAALDVVAAYIATLGERN